MTDQQPEALKLAALIEADMPCDGSEIAAELRRLSELEQDANLYIRQQEKRIAALEAELLEQARIVGMGAERELAQLGRIAALEKALRMAVEALEELQNQDESHGLPYDVLCALRDEAITAARQTLK